MRVQTIILGTDGGPIRPGTVVLVNPAHIAAAYAYRPNVVTLELVTGTTLDIAGTLDDLDPGHRADPLIDHDREILGALDHAGMVGIDHAPPRRRVVATLAPGATEDARQTSIRDSAGRGPLARCYDRDHDTGMWTLR